MTPIPSQTSVSSVTVCYYCYTIEMIRLYFNMKASKGISLHSITGGITVTHWTHLVAATESLGEGYDYLGRFLCDIRMYVT